MAHPAIEEQINAQVTERTFAMIQVTYLDRENNQRHILCPMSANDAGPTQEKDRRQLVRKAYGSGPLKLERTEVLSKKPKCPVEL